MILQTSSLNGAQLNGSSLLGCSLSLVRGQLWIDLGGSAPRDQSDCWLGTVTFLHMSHSLGFFPHPSSMLTGIIFMGMPKFKGNQPNYSREQIKVYKSFQGVGLKQAFPTSAAFYWTEQVTSLNCSERN